MTTVSVGFCGEVTKVEPGSPFYIGREADLSLDDNPYLHRRFLSIHREFDLWWLTNVGTLLTATVTDDSGAVQAWLAPGAKLPIVFDDLTVMFTAGPTTYDFTIQCDEASVYSTSRVVQDEAGSTTIMPVTLTSSQRKLILALAENMLRRETPGRGSIPSSADAAERLGWSMTTFNRKLDNVCDKLDKLGVTGLRGGRGKLAVNRRSRLVEYAVTTHLVSSDDLVLLDDEALSAPQESDR